MLPAPPTSLPSWLVSGLALGLATSVVFAVVFALGERYVPAPDRSGRRIGASARQREEFRAFFRTADEPFREDHRIGTTTVAFYLPAHDVAITFDPRAYLRLADGDTHIVLCEYGMPAAALGRRLPFDIGADSGESWGSTTGDWRSSTSGNWDSTTGDWGSRATGDWDRGPGPRATRPNNVDDAFEFLGLSRGADADTVQSAYRERVKELHPDQGGSEDAFKRLQRAYTTATEHAS